MIDDDEIDCNTLLEAIEKIEGFVEGNADRISIGVETDLDEAFFIGTPQAFARLAIALLRAAKCEGSYQEVNGVGGQWSTHSHDVSDNTAQVVVGAECIVLTDKERCLLVEHFRNLSGD